MSNPSWECGRPFPLGAHFDGEGVNFAVWSGNATRIEVCLYDSDGRRELGRVALPGRTRDVWHGYLRGARPGLLYGLRAEGPWQPSLGHRFNPNKLLLDPWAREIVGRIDWSGDVGTDPRHPTRFDSADNGSDAPKCRVIDDAYAWRDDRRPQRPRDECLVYELHVKGFTQRHPDIPASIRGTYAGLAHPAAIAHLQRLGVTTVELLPVQQALDERRLVEQGLVNYWGYNTIGFFCPDPRLASVAARSADDPGRAVRDEFRNLVRALHTAGIEVVLDIVFNHTAEADERGPLLCWRGLDNAAWYRLDPQWPDRYENASGCGNTLDLRRPRVLQFVMDVLRYWVDEMHVDGFRFDLATALARGEKGFDPRAPLFQAIAQDPILAGVRLIAEPWDMGSDGYQLGRFPAGWMEWNDRFRDGIRRFWLCAHQTRGEFAQRLCASSDTFQTPYREPADSLNYLTSHDGFTLRDLVSYERRHNEANGEGNLDGHANNYSCHFGVEGDTDRIEVQVVRGRVQRALLATLLLSQGTPMIAAGSEIGHTQQGNNNAYCQDAAVSWLDWDKADRALLEYVVWLTELRRRYLPLRNAWYHGLRAEPEAHDLEWLVPEGGRLQGDHWHHSEERCLGALIHEPGRGVQRVLLLVNGEPSRREFRLPGGRWRVTLDSSRADGRSSDSSAFDAALSLPAQTVMLLEEVT